MIEIVTDKDRNLKNIKQIGTPREDNKIYIENFAYAKIKENSYKEKRVFVLMGHTERMEGRYATFIEAAIPVREIDFAGNTPRWNNSTWSEVFHEIKRLYEDMIIVGWAVDIKGMQPKVTPELERVHREHFGGVHQLLFLLDTLEPEEIFFIYKENKLISKDGFYIYHRARKKEEAEPIPITVLPEKEYRLERGSSLKNSSRRSKTMEEATIHRIDPQVDVELDVSELEPRRTGRYRQMMQEQKKEKSADSGNIGLAVAVAMLIFVIGVGAYENRDSIFGGDDAVETNILPEQISTESGIIIEDIETIEDTEVDADVVWPTDDVGVMSDSTETAVDIIPVEVISGTESEE